MEFTILRGGDNHQLRNAKTIRHIMEDKQSVAAIHNDDILLTSLLDCTGWSLITIKIIDFLFQY